MNVYECYISMLFFGCFVPFNNCVLKVYSNELFLFQLTNDLCRSFTKVVIILFLSKAVFIKRILLCQLFCAKNRTTIKVLYYFLEFVRLYHNEQCHHARGKLVHVTVRNIV